jgi:hypothetical protein
MAFGCNIIPIESIYLYFSGIFREGWVYFYKVIMTYLKTMREELLDADELGVLQILKSNANSGRINGLSRFQLDWEKILNDAVKPMFENPDKVSKMFR